MINIYHPDKEEPILRTAACDYCSTGCVALYIDRYNDFVILMKLLGWERIKVDNTFFHKCPDCTEKNNDPEPHGNNLHGIG